MPPGIANEYDHLPIIQRLSMFSPSRGPPYLPFAHKSFLSALLTLHGVGKCSQGVLAHLFLLTADLAMGPRTMCSPCVISLSRSAHVLPSRLMRVLKQVLAYIPTPP